MDYLVMGRRGYTSLLPRLHRDISEHHVRVYYMSNNWEISWILPIGSKKFALAALDEYRERGLDATVFIEAVAYQNAVSALRTIVEEFEIKEREL